MTAAIFLSYREGLRTPHKIKSHCVTMVALRNKEKFALQTAQARSGHAVPTFFIILEAFLSFLARYKASSALLTSSSTES